MYICCLFYKNTSEFFKLGIGVYCIYSHHIQSNRSSENVDEQDILHVNSIYEYRVSVDVGIKGRKEDEKKCLYNIKKVYTNKDVRVNACDLRSGCDLNL